MAINRTEIVLRIEDEPLFRSGKKWASYQRYSDGRFHRLYVAAETQQEVIDRHIGLTIHPEMLSFSSEITPNEMICKICKAG